MDERLIDFVKYVQAHPGASSSDIAGRFGVSVRTVRNWVHDANEALGDAAGISSDRGVYTLLVKSRPRFERLTSIGNSIWGRTPSTSDRRAAYLLSNLLFRDDWVTIDSLAEELFVTRRTISTSLKAVERELADYDLDLERRPHHGIRVWGDELARRRCLARMISLNADFTRSPKTAGYHIVGNTTSGDLALCAQGVLAEQNLALSSSAFRNLLVHLCIAIGRASGGYTGTLSKSMQDSLQSLTEYSTARILARRSAELSGNPLGEADVAYLALCLTALQGAEREGAYADPVFSSTAAEVMAEVTDQIDRRFRTHLSQDRHAIQELVARLVPMLTRLSYGIERGSGLPLDAVSTTYPLAFEMGRIVADAVVAKLGIAVPDEELVTLTLFFALVLDRPDVRVDGARILVVGEFGSDGARLLEQRLRNALGSHATHLILRSTLQLTDGDYAQADAVVASTPLPEDIALPTMRISAFPSEEELARVRLFVAKLPLES